MSKKLIFVFTCLTLFAVSGLFGFAHVRQDQDVEKREQLDSDARKQFMRGKLLSSQKIVEGLSLKDYNLVREGADGVTALVMGQHWFVIDTPEYREYSRDMETSAKRLKKAADDKNIEAAALRYFDLTLNCIDCHQYLETLGH